MEKYSNKESYAIFDATGEIKQVTFEITQALQKKDEELVEELFEDLIDLINSHENRYEAVAYAIVHSCDLVEEYRSKIRGYMYVAKRLKDRLRDRMNQQGLKELDTGIFRLWIKKNVHPTVIVDIPAEELPKEFHSIKPDKVKLREALSNGEEIEGVTLELGEHVRVTVKISLRET